jgi:DNA invertase Pin-like site-specific DNA recombinase
LQIIKPFEPRLRQHRIAGIRERTGEGRKRAMANGVKFGRKRKLSDYQRAEASKRRAEGETLTSIARSYGVAISMISRL